MSRFHECDRCLSLNESAAMIQRRFRWHARRRHERTRELWLRLRTHDENMSLDTYRCPITTEIARYPVLCLVDGHLYESEALSRWVAIKNTSPLTRETVTFNDIVPFPKWRELTLTNHAMIARANKILDEALKELDVMNNTFEN